MAKCYNAFLVFHDWRDAFEALDGDSCKAILLAMFDYSVSGIEPPEFDDPAAKMAARFIFPAMERRARDAENGRKGGNKRVENASAKSTVEKPVDNGVDNATFYGGTTPLEPPLNPPSTLNKTRQDKDKTETTENKTIQDEDETKQTDVSSVIGLAIEVCDWLEVPTGVSTKTHQLIQNYGYTNDDYRKLFEMANESDFLRGGGDRGWMATFDWLIEHMDEVMSGKYRTWKKPPESGRSKNTDISGSSFEVGDFWETALKRSYGDNYREVMKIYEETTGDNK